ncbi:hypothetical protein [Actinomyces trachealis]|uniref:hypothetical protein n=1 Tax=Actinomyces trachealis TaxID=2763540 RepID=UPI001892A13A|nr:hypothetical protein [Actinomyces trachealis]
MLGREPQLISDQEPVGLVSIEHTMLYLERFFQGDSIGQQALMQELITYAQQVGWNYSLSNSMEDPWVTRRPRQTFSAFSLSTYPWIQQSQAISSTSVSPSASAKADLNRNTTYMTTQSLLMK